MAQWVKNPALTLQGLRLLLWHRFDPWPRNFYISSSAAKKKKKKTINNQVKKEKREAFPVVLNGLRT